MSNDTTGDPKSLVAADVAIVGAGAAGLATAIFVARRNPSLAVILLDGANKPGAKILISGGGRCNVTNTIVEADDFHGGSRNTIRRILKEFTAADAVALFDDLGVTLHEEEHGKLFPDSHSAKTILGALLREVERHAVRLLAGHRVTSIDRNKEGFAVRTPNGDFTSPIVVLATGGMSLPKTGSDGGGYQLVQSLGHTIVPTTPALVPLVLDGEFHKALSGISHEVELIIAVEKPVRVRGALLWTHFGISGPVVLDASRHWHRAILEHRPVAMSANLIPQFDFASAEQAFLELAAKHPITKLQNALAAWLPVRVSEALVTAASVNGHTQLGQVSREVRQRLIRLLLDWPLPVRASRGYNYAEVTAGGVPLSEIDPTSMMSRQCPGVFLVGEILDVDGRIGGFNFQWSWSTAWVAAKGIIAGRSQSRIPQGTL